ncbi:HNH endonuclease signature motif containing protein [Desulfoscipio gibsoniae]|uniref:HNH endonuclease signature motif containing protein n=1 Tax=Desulfoscipio gibsoniae TaxID=102134 RepID=UPI000232B441|nr:HNH endonuclease signature motif containing protein [Desulfoscipio gibsoniae]
MKNQNETPYTKEGRELYKIRTGKKSILARADELLSLHLSELIGKRLTNTKYNFEYFLNRAYAFNRDLGKCRICGLPVVYFDVHIHHIKPNLPIEQVNKVPNLVTVHKQCHYLIHSNNNCSGLETGIRNQIFKFREKLGIDS